MALTFPQSARLKTPAEFDAVYNRKKSAADGLLVVFAGPAAGGKPRLGLSVSRKVGNAVVRNRWKRLLREVFRTSVLPACDFVVVPRKGLKLVPPAAAVWASFRKLAADAAKRVEKASGGRQPPVEVGSPATSPGTEGLRPPLATIPDQP